MKRRGRLTITDGNDYLSAKFEMLKVGIYYGNAGRIIGALAEDPKTIDEFKKAFSKFSEAPLDEILEPLNQEIPLNIKPGESIEIPEPNDPMGTSFSIFIDLNKKEIKYNNINVPLRSSEEIYKINEDCIERIPYRLSKEWKEELIYLDLKLERPWYSIQDERFKGNITIAIHQLGENAFAPMIVLEKEAMLTTCLMTKNEPTITFTNVNHDFMEIVRKLSNDLNKCGYIALEKFFKDYKFEELANLKNSCSLS